MPLAQSTAAPATVYSKRCEPDTCLNTDNDGAEGFIHRFVICLITCGIEIPESSLSRHYSLRLLRTYHEENIYSYRASNQLRC